MNRRIIMIIAMLLVTVCGTSFASQRINVSNYDRNPITRSVDTTNLFGSARNVSAGVVEVQYSLVCRNIDKNEVTVDIQQYKNGRWITVSSSKYTSYSTYGYGVKEYSVTDNYTYRAKLTGKVYKNGVLIETSYVYTNEVDC